MEENDDGSETGGNEEKTTEFHYQINRQMTQKA